MKRNPVRGLPRTSAQARKEGFTSVTIDFESLSSKEQRSWINLSSLNVRAGSIGRIRPPKKGPGSKPDTTIVCYYNEKTKAYDDCVEINDKDL